MKRYDVPGLLLPLVMVAGAVLGGVYIVVAPIVGSAAILALAARRAWQGLRHGLSHLSALFAHRWVPGESHFAGKDRRGG